MSPHREGQRPKPVMHGSEKSDCKIARNIDPTRNGLQCIDPIGKY